MFIADRAQKIFSLYRQYVALLELEAPVLPEAILSLTVYTHDFSTAQKEISIALAPQAPVVTATTLRLPPRDSSSLNHKYCNAELLAEILKDLNQKIIDLKTLNTSNKSIIVAEKLKEDLQCAFTQYPTRHQSEADLVQYCTSLINQAKPKLQQELGWVDYLTNLLKKIANAFNTVVNTIIGPKLGFFTYKKAVLISEIEDIEKNISDKYTSSLPNGSTN